MFLKHAFPRHRLSSRVQHGVVTKSALLSLKLREQAAVQMGLIFIKNISTNSQSQTQDGRTDTHTLKGKIGNLAGDKENDT